ncbi:uncharacterized protein FSUBG_14065 [Fusarium subglutinans]|uniref:Uncharacterized protein n=1 Tax=Gibberella subglutinans TaxID=42677 RepID=A0A8H5NRG2_GIBSU|nr:uncharacterized protein FSUBG_14065 [Fusarium subglutinans]KAF5574238.1 hypothetical protein FSUBG_14065 [Fusarium subglutinans]
MKHCFILALWSVGALAGPCNPIETAGSSTFSGGLEDCNDELAKDSSTFLAVTLPGQDVAVETSIPTESSDNENAQVSVSIRPTEPTQVINGQETGLASGDDTKPGEDGSAPATTTGSAAGEASDNATSAGANGPGDVDTETVPANVGNTDLNGETTQGLSPDTGGLPTATGSGNSNQEQPTTESQPTDHPVSEKTSAFGSDNTSAVDTSPKTTQTEAHNGAHTTTHGDDATSKHVSDNPDTSSVSFSSGNDQSTNVDTATTANPTATNDGSDSTPTTNAPEGLSPTTVGGHPEWVSNTWITTTGDNSETTIVPVLVGCPGCGGKGSGIVLFGFPKTTGTWFKLPGLPKFKFPCIPPFCTTSPDTSKDSDEDDDDDDNKSYSTTCTDKATVTDCFVTCTTYTGPAGSAITPDCKTTCTKTHTGCDVVGTTTTPSATACGPSGDSSCKSCERKLVSEVDPEDLDEDTEDSEESDLERRVPKKKKFVNVRGCGKLPKNPKFPDYPGGNTVLDNDRNIIPNNSPLKDIKK